MTDERTAAQSRRGVGNGPELRALVQVWRSFNSLKRFVPRAFLDRLGKDLEAYIAEAGTVDRARDRERVKRNTREASKRGLI